MVVLKAIVTRDQIGAFAYLRNAVVVKRVFKTRSGKTLCGTMRKIANRENYTVPSTIDDPNILSEIADFVSPIGYACKIL